MNKKNWSTLKKGDILYLLIPYEDEEKNIRYRYQESQVINTHQYDWCTNVRFKYTDNNCKRRRIELCVNTLKYDCSVVSSRKETGWARDYDIDYGDIIVSFNKYDLEVILRKVINKTIKIQEEQISRLNKFINHLKEVYEEIQ